MLMMSALLASSAAATAALIQPGGGRPGLSQSRGKMATSRILHKFQ
jgi:hypothetical protein